MFFECLLGASCLPGPGYVRHTWFLPSWSFQSSGKTFPILPSAWPSYCSHPFLPLPGASHLSPDTQGHRGAFAQLIDHTALGLVSISEFGLVPALAEEVSVHESPAQGAWGGRDDGVTRRTARKSGLQSKDPVQVLQPVCVDT